MNIKKYLILILLISLKLTSTKAHAMISSNATDIEAQSISFPNQKTSQPCRSEKPELLDKTNTTSEKSAPEKEVETDSSENKVEVKHSDSATENILAQELYNKGTQYFHGIKVPIDKDQAFTYFEQAATHGNTNALFYLGLCYYLGFPVPKNIEKAETYFKQTSLFIEQQASKGDAECKYFLGFMKENGLGNQSQNLTETIELYKQAADNEYIIAQYKLGKCFSCGHGVKQDYAEAIHWYEKAAKNNYAEASYKLGECYYYGHGVKQNYITAIKWFEKAANQEHSIAQNNLGVCYYYGHGVKQNYITAIKWFEKAAAQKYAAAQHNLAVCYEYGHGTTQDYQKAIKWYKLAADQKHTATQYKLAVCYEHGRGVIQSYAEAVKWYRLAATQGYANAQNNLGSCYYYARGVKQDCAEAARWYEKAATQGYANAQHNLGECYYFGCGVIQNYNEAAKWYKKAAIQDHVGAQYKLGECYEYGRGVIQNYNEAAKWYERAANQNHINAQYQLGECYYSGNGVKQNYTIAVKWYKLAAQQKHAGAQFKLGFCYKHGRGVTQSYETAFTWYKLAAEQNYTFAQHNLGLCYKYGHGVTRDYAKAINWFRLAASHGDPYAQFELGECYKCGHAVMQNINEAATWYRLAAEKNHTKAQYAIGICYRDGQGVKQNYTEAIKWFRKAAEKDHANAQLALGWCYINGQGTPKNLAEGSKWIHLYRFHLKKDDGSLAVLVAPFERTCNLFSELEKLKSDVKNSDEAAIIAEFVVIYLGDHFSRLSAFLNTNGIVIPQDKALLKEMIEHKSIDMCELNKLLTEAYEALKCAQFVFANIKDPENQEAFKKILEVISKKDFCLSVYKSNITLTNKFLHPYVISPWRSQTIPVIDINNLGILSNIFGAGFSETLVHCDAVSAGENMYDYIFGSKGTFKNRLAKLCENDQNRFKFLLAREMYWLKHMKEKCDANLLNEEERRIYEKCKNLVEIHFVSAKGECHNELADIIILWANDIDICEDSIGIGIHVSDQKSFDERFTTLFRQFLAEKISSNDYIGNLIDSKTASKKIEHMWCSLNSNFGPEFRNFYRFLVAHLLNVIPTVGTNFIVDRELSGKDIATIVAEAIDLKEMCNIAQNIYQGLSDERDALDDSAMSLEKDTIKVKLAMDIENSYSVSFEEFCSIVDQTCTGNFKERLNKFLEMCTPLMDETTKLERENINQWISESKLFTISELTDMIYKIDMMFSKTSNIPELARFNSMIGGRGDKFSEYYAKVLYPIHLLKAGFISFRK